MYREKVKLEWKNKIGTPTYLRAISRFADHIMQQMCQTFRIGIRLWFIQKHNNEYSSCLESSSLALEWTNEQVQMLWGG